MKYLKFKLFAFFIALTALSACSADENECYASGAVPIDSVTGPETAFTNEEITFNVSFKIFSSCGSFAGFDQSEGNPKNIFLKIQYIGCQCTSVNKSEIAEYTFSASEPGEYELNFFSGDDTYITKTVTVSEPE